MPRWSSTRSIRTLASCMILLVAGTLALAQRTSNTPIRIGVGALTDTMDPHACASTLCFTSFYAVYDALTRIDENGNAQPALAASWSTIDDVTWEFRLRPDAKFHSGENLTSADVVATIERLIDPNKTLPASGRIATVKSAYAVDDLTVRIVTSTADPILLGRLSVVFILRASDIAGGTTNSANGTGAWRVSSFRPGEALTLDAFDESWRGAPASPRVIITSLPEDSSRVAALQAGDVDLVQNLPIDFLGLLEAQGFQVAAPQLGSIQMVNLSSTRGAPLDDPRVRLALNYAVDREALFNSILGGRGSLADGQMIGPDGVGHNPAVSAYPYDPELARRLLAEAGYPDGFSIRWDGPSGAYIQDRATQEAIVAQLSQVGVKVDLNFMEQGAFIDGLLKGTLAPMSFLNWNYFPIMDADFVYNWFQSSNGTKIYANPQFDELFGASRRAVDATVRVDLLDQLAQITHDDPTGIYLFHPPDVFGLAAGVRGFTGRPDSVIWLDDLRLE